MSSAKKTRQVYIKKYSIIADSSDRDIIKYPNNNSYTLKLPTLYRNVIGARLITLELPSSYYKFSKTNGNTTLGIILYNNLGGNTLPEQYITIPDGNYSINSLVSTLQTAINANVFFQQQGIIFTVTVDPNNYLFNISVNLNRIFVIDTYSTSSLNINWGLAYNLGFKKNTNVIGNVITGSSIINVNQYNYILMEITNFNSMDECANPIKSTNGDYSLGQVNAAFAKIQINVNSYDILYQINTFDSLNKVELNPRIGKLDKLSIKWRYHDGTPVNFNGLEHSFSIELECLEVAMR